jgi:hypothetical protein
VQLSPNFAKKEMERDGCVLPNEGIVLAYVRLSEDILEPLRAWANEPFYITSGYRSKKVNARIGGAVTSQHIATEHHCAVDGYFESHQTMQAPFDWLRMESGLGFDQVILEHGKYRAVIHISWARTPRRMALEGATFNQTAYQARFVAPEHPEAT